MGEKHSCLDCRNYIDKDNLCKIHGRFAKTIPCRDFEWKPVIFQQTFDELL